MSLRILRIASGALLLALCAAPRAQGLDAMGLVRSVYPDASCSEQIAAGPCFCGPIACRLRVMRFVPVAFIETVARAGDSVLDAAIVARLAGARVGGSGSSSLSATDNTAEAHVWLLPDPLGLPCVTCTTQHARAPAGPRPAPGAALCDAASALTETLLQGDSALQPFQAVLVYASELDAWNWHTGCRDAAAAARAAAGGVLACSALTDFGLHSRCIGRWGLLLPRQMRDIGTNPVLHSAKTSVRAMSLAREQLGVFPYPVDDLGRLQQVYPAVSACFTPGTLPLPALPQSARPVRASADGRYGWVYWRPTTCCVSWVTAAQCALTHAH